MTDSGRRLREATRRLGAHETGRRLQAASLAGAGVSLAGLAALVAATRFAPFGPGAPGPLLALAAAGFAVAVLLPIVLAARAWRLRRPALRDLEEAARRTEAQAAVLKERLVPALQVLRVRDEARTGYSAALVDAVVDATVGDVEAVRPGALPYNASYRRGLRTAAAGGAAFVLVGAVLGPAATWRGLVDVASAATRLGPRPRPEFLVRPGDTSVARGTGIRLAADVRHAVVADGRVAGVLEWREGPEGPWRRVALSSSAVSDEGVEVARFEHAIGEVRESFRYRFRHGGATSAEHGVRAVAAPSLAIEEVRYRYPEYAALPDRVVQDGGGDLAALRGTRAEIAIRSTEEVRRGLLRLGSGAELPLALEPERRLRARLDIRSDDTYVLVVEDALGLTNPNPLEYRVRALADEAPFIRLLEPGEDRDLDESMRETLRFSALDDYGLGPVELVWEVSRRPGRAERKTILVPEGVRTEVDARWTWELSALDLLPGDAVVYHLEVRDNNAIDGPSTSRTREYVLRFPTLGEVFAEIDEEQDASIDALSDVVDEARKIESKLKDVSREILKQGESSWENRQEVERALQAQEQLAEQLRETREQIESSLSDLAESEFATLEAVQKMERIRQLLDEVATREMKEALEKLREALEEQNPYEKHQDLAEFDRSQEELMKQLDRILENLEQFRLEEQLKAAVRRVEELAARQERVNDELAREGKPEETRKEAPGEAGAQDEPPEGERDARDAAEEGKDPARESAEDGEDAPPEAADERDGPAKEQEEPSPASDPELDRLASEEKSLAKETRDVEKEIEELARRTAELRESRDAQEMSDVSRQMSESGIPQTMEEMSGDLQEGRREEAGERGEEALTELRELLAALGGAQQGMGMRMAQISQAAINRAVRDLLALSADQETLAGDLADIPRNSASATRSFADEQQLLLRGARRVSDMLHEVAKDTPLMDSAVGRSLDAGLSSMSDAAQGLETGAVHLASDEGSDAVEELNAVVIQLLRTSETMSSCASGMNMSSFMQQLQKLSQDQQALNDALRKLRSEGGSSMDRRLQAGLQDMAAQQQRIREELQSLLKEMGGGQGLLGRLDGVADKLDDVARKLAEGRLDDQTLRDQEWALTRLLDSQRSIRERDLGRERRSETGEEVADLPPPSALPRGTEDSRRDLREDLLKALERRYPPKYEDLIRRYFRELAREVPAPDLP
jgi:hypothetical protein